MNTQAIQTNPGQTDLGRTPPAPRSLGTREPGWFTTHVFNGLMVWSTRMGLSVWGSRELRVRGRVSGGWRTNPVNLLTHDGQRFLVAPHGARSGSATSRPGAPVSCVSAAGSRTFRGVEVADADKVEILRAYLRRWKMEVGVFFDGVGPDAPTTRLRRSLRVTRCSASSWSTRVRGAYGQTSPRMQVAMLSTAQSSMARRVSAVADPMWGSRMTFGIRAAHRPRRAARFRARRVRRRRCAVRRVPGSSGLIEHATS